VWTSPRIPRHIFDGQKGKLNFAMYEYIKKMLDKLPPDIQGIAKIQNKSRM